MAKFKFDWDALKENIVKEDTKKKFEKDTRFWTPTKDAAGLANAIFRFVPDTEGQPFVKLYSHSFDYMVEGQKKYWIKNCVNTFGYDRECPICAKNMEYWNSSYDSDKAIASKRKRKLQFISNIYIVKNPACPEDEGKVFLFKYGQKIYDKIKALMFPSEADLADEDFKSFVPFDLYEGADFKLKVEKQGDFPNYDKSAFSVQKPLAGGDDKKIEKIMGMTYVLSEFVQDNQFPTNAETIKVLGKLLGLDEVTEPVKEKEAKKEAKKEKAPKEEPEEISDSTDLTEDDTDVTSDDESSTDDDMEFFNSLK
jgi:hypothetical protein